MVIVKWRPVRGWGPRHDVEEFHIITSYTGNLGAVRGALSHSPHRRGKQTVNVNVTLALSPSLDFFSWEHWPYDLESQGGHAHPQVPAVPRGRRGRALRAKVTVGVGRQDLPTQKAGPWIMYNLRTPIIIVLFFL